MSLEALVSGSKENTQTDRDGKKDRKRGRKIEQKRKQDGDL